MYNRRRPNWPREELPVIRHVVLTIAACQLAALLTIGAVIWHVDGEQPTRTAIAGQMSSIR